MNITTTKKAARNGTGNILATYTLNGKRRQVTIPYDHAQSEAANHAEAAVRVIRRTVEMNRWDHVAHNSKVETLANGKRRWTVEG